MKLMVFFLFNFVFINIFEFSKTNSGFSGVKRMCFQCNMPYHCASGFCYGDYCVKSIVPNGNYYVSKGCENKSTSIYARSMAERSDNDFSAVDVGCVETAVFGVPNIVCYCNDNDFCNFAHISKINLLIILPVVFFVFR